MTEPAPPRGEIRALTGLRIVAALWVVMIHFQNVLLDGWGPVARALRPLVMSGWLGVDLFFLLSGFVLTWSYVDRLGDRWDAVATVHFVWARLIRIWPLYALLTVAAAGFLLVTGWDQGTGGVYPRIVTWGALLEQLGLVQMWSRQLNLGAGFVAPGWSLSVELVAYLAFPLLVLLVHRLRRLPVAVLAVLALVPMASMALFSYQTGLADFWLPWQGRIAAAFTSGMLCCLVVLRLRTSAAARRLAPFVGLLALVEIGVVLVWADARSATGDANRLGVALVVFPVLVGALALADGGLARALSGDAMVLGGRISFALYLVHCLVLDVFQWSQTQSALLAPGSPAASFVEANLVLVCLGLSWVLWRFVEEPARGWLRGHVPRSRGAAPRPSTRTSGGGAAASLTPVQIRSAPVRPTADRHTRILPAHLPSVPPTRAGRGPGGHRPEPRAEAVGLRA